MPADIQPTVTRVTISQEGVTDLAVRFIEATFQTDDQAESLALEGLASYLQEGADQALPRVA